MKPYSLAAAILVAAASIVPVFAQPESGPTESVTVFAPYVVKKNTTGPLKNRVTTVSMSNQVSYHDLDLNTPDGQAALETRVKQVAENVCDKLNRRYSVSGYMSVSENKDCVKNATDEAMIQVRGVEEAAK